MIRIVTPPAAFPCTLAEAKDWCRIDASDISQDGVLNMLIATMTDYAEHLTGRAFVERTLELNADYFEFCMELPWAPLIGIDSIAYTDSSGHTGSIDVATLDVDAVSQPGRIRPIWGAYWPPVGYGLNPVRIQYRAGYRAPGSPQDLTDNNYLPANMRTWLAARLGTLYDNRSQVIIERATVDQIPRDFADGLLDSLVVGSRLF